MSLYIITWVMFLAKIIFLDGATLSYDLYQAQEEHPDGGDFTLAVCPGIGNNSESVYIR